MIEPIQVPSAKTCTNFSTEFIRGFSAESIAHRGQHQRTAEGGQKSVNELVVVSPQEQLRAPSGPWRCERNFESENVASTEGPAHLFPGSFSADFQRHRRLVQHLGLGP